MVKRIIGRLNHYANYLNPKKTDFSEYLICMARNRKTVAAT